MNQIYYFLLILVLVGDTNKIYDSNYPRRLTCVSNAALKRASMTNLLYETRLWSPPESPAGSLITDWVTGRVTGWVTGRDTGWDTGWVTDRVTG